MATRQADQSSSLFEELERAFAADDERGRAVEARLVSQARSGEQAAFGALYQRYVTPIYRYCWAHTGGPQQEVEDLTSAVFLRAWQAIARYEDRGRPFLAWLHTIARNVVIDHLRQRGRSVELDDSLPAALSVAELATQRAEIAQIQHALNQLTEEQRQVIIYRFLLGYSGEEAAEAMGKRAGAVRALQLRALQALRQILQPGEEG